MKSLDSSCDGRKVKLDGLRRMMFNNELEVHKNILEPLLSQSISSVLDVLMESFIAANFTGPLPPWSYRDSDIVTYSVVLLDYISALEEERIELIRDKRGGDTLLMRTLVEFEPDCALLTAEDLNIVLKGSRDVRKWMIIDGEQLNPKVKHPLSLYLMHALIRLPDVTAQLISPLTELKILMIYQRCLSRRSHTLYCKIMKLVQHVSLNLELPASWYLEVALAAHYYYEFDDAWNLLQKACKRMDLDVCELAFVGVRTRWQVFKTAQLVVDANIKETVSTNSGTTTSGSEQVGHLSEQIEGIEKRWTLDSLHQTFAQSENYLSREIEGEREGHDLYDCPRAEAGGEIERKAPLPPTAVAVLLALSMDIERCNPKHELTREHVEAYIQRALTNPIHLWTTKAMSLLLRSRTEGERVRVAQRSLLQLQELVDEFTIPASDQLGLKYRTIGFHLVLYPSWWERVTELADRYSSIKLFKTSIEYYEKVLDWEGIIHCSTQLERRDSVVHLATSLLQSDPNNPSLWIALGMATGSREPLQKAWEVSEHKSTAAAREIAKWCIRKDLFEDAITYFDHSISLNPTFGGDWFVLGYAALRLERWQRAAEAFTRVVQLDPKDGLSWNNLGMSLLRLKRLRPAFTAFIQASKYDRTDWHTWCNLFSVSVELGEVNDALQSLGYMISIGKRSAVVDAVSLRKLSELLVQRILMRDAPDNEKPQLASDDTFTSACEHEAIDILPLGCEEDDEKCADTKPSGTSESEDAMVIRERQLERMKSSFVHSLGELSSLHPFDDDLFVTCALFYEKIGDDWKSFEYRVRAYRAVQKEGWSSDKSSFEKVVQCTKDMCKVACTILMKCKSGEVTLSDSEKSELLVMHQCVQHVLDASNDTFEDHPLWRELKDFSMSDSLLSTST